jgi:hypothetical protein
MNDEDIRQFLTAFGDYMRHSETEIHEYEKREESRHFTHMLFEKKAAELEVTVDYYLQEFL